MRKVYTLPGLLIMVAMLLLVSACGGSSVTAGQLLTNSANAMKSIKSLHMNMTMSVNLTVSGLSNSTTSTTSLPPNTNATVNASGDEVLPGQASFNLSASANSSSKFSFAEIVKDNKIYMRNAQGQWYVMDKSQLAGSSDSTSSLFSNASAPDFSKLLNLLEKDVTVVDHGDETLNGASLRHISVTLDKTGLIAFVKNIDAFKQLPASSQQSTNSALNSSVNTFNASLDFWFDESTSYIHRIELKLNTAVDVTKIPGASNSGSTTSMPSSFSLKTDILIDLSKFNDSSIKITAPTNATPTDNPGVLFGAAPTQ